MGDFVPDSTCISSQLLNQGAMCIPEEEISRFKPAMLCIYEWRDYWLDLPGINWLQVGSYVIYPDHGSWFHLRFENQLGLVKIQPFPCIHSKFDPVIVEVISPKFDTPQKHLDFFASLLDDLFQRITRLPFTIQARTERSVVEALRPPTPLFTYYFLRHYCKEIQASLQIILADPHRLLTSEDELVSLSAVNEVDGEILMDVFRNPSRWVKNSGHPMAARMKGFIPQRVIQHLAQESFDTQENRFILAFLGQLLNAADQLFSQRWWNHTPVIHQRAIRETYSLIQQGIIHPIFNEVGEQQILPVNSQVLLRKEGYREMLTLWQLFHQARRPLFEPLHHAIEIRNVAELYEYWVFFELVDRIGDIYNLVPIMELNASDESGLDWKSKAHFGPYGTLIYNQTFYHRSTHFHTYSTTMRPDYVWCQNGVSKVVLDAKFSFSIVDFEIGEEEQEGSVITRPKLDDLYKMHTYRDALDLHAAVAIYPGNTSVFFDKSQGRSESVDLQQLLSGQMNGIGAIPMKPGNQEQL